VVIYIQTSFKFKNIESNYNKLLDIIKANQNVLRYIKYLSDEPLAQKTYVNGILVNQPNIEEDPIDNGYIIPSLFDGKIPDQETVRLFLSPIIGNFKSYPLSDIGFEVNIVLPISKFILSGAGTFRPFRIMDEIAQNIDQQNVAGIGETEITGFKCFKLENSSYLYMSSLIKISSSTMKGLR
jgi:hypothetical protein